MRFAIALALLGSACAAHRPAPYKALEAQYSSPGQPKPKGVMFCQMERETGSNIMDRVCTYEDSDDLDRGLADLMLSVQRRASQHPIAETGQPPHSPPVP